MRPEATPEDLSRKRKAWLIVLIVSVFALAICWSVDPSIVYILTGLVAISLFKVIQYRKPQAEPFQRSYQEQYRQGSSFWDEVKGAFNRNDSTQPSQSSDQKKSKIFVAIVGGFIAFMFLIAVLSALFSDDSGADSLQLDQRASELYERQQYDSAALYYRLAIEKDPENADLYLKRGNALLNSNRTDSALILYDKALSLQPNFPAAQYNKSLIYYNRKQYRNSITEGKKAVALDPGYADAMLMIGDSFYEQSLLDSAMGWYETAYGTGYRSAPLSHMMAYIYDTKGQTQKAIPFYKEAISYDTTRTAIYARLGVLIPGEDGNLYRQKAAQYPQQ